MLTSKQRAKLRAVANSYETILTVGKGEIDSDVIKQAKDAVKKREMIKGRVLENSPYSARQAAELIAVNTGSEVVQVIGSKFILYRENTDIPKEKRILLK